MPDPRYSTSPDIIQEAPAGNPTSGIPAVDPMQRHFDASGNRANEIPASPDDAPAPAAAPANPPSAPNYKLWKKLNDDQLYTKSYEDFQKQFNNTQSVNKLYSKLNEDQLYTKSKDEFNQQFFDHLPSPQAQDARSYLTDYMGSSKANDAIDNITGTQYDQEFFNQQRNANQGVDNQTIGQPVPLRLTDRMKADRLNYQTAAVDNPDMMRPVLKEAKRQYPQDAPQIDNAMYVSDAANRPHSDAVVKYYSDQIKNGDLQYDPVNKQLVRPVGMWDGLFQGMTDHAKAIDDYNYYASHSDKEVIDRLNQKSADYDPDMPVRKALSGLGSVGNLIGNSISPLVKMSGPGFLTGGLATAAELGAPEIGLAVAAGSTLGVGAGALDFHNTVYANKLPEAYRDYKEHHPGASDTDALNYAKQEANFSGALAGIQAVLLGKGSEGKAATQAVRYGAGAKKVFSDIADNIIPHIKKAVPDIAMQGGSGAIVQAMENLHQGKDIGKNVTEGAVSNMLFAAALHAVKAPDILFSEGARTNLMGALAKAPPDVVHDQLERAVRMQTMTPEKATQTMREIEAARVNNAGKPDTTSPLTPEAEDFLKDYEIGNKPLSPNRDLLKIAKDNGIETKGEEGEPDLTVQQIVNRLKKKQSEVSLPETFEKPPGIPEAPNYTPPKKENDAVQESETGTVLQREPGQTGSPGSERPGVEPSQQGEETAGEGEGENKKLVGISHDLVTERNQSIGESGPERGQGRTPEEAVANGRKILGTEGFKSEDVEGRIKNDPKNVNENDLDAARAHYENLQKETNKAFDDHGAESPEYKTAKAEELRWDKEVIAPMRVAGHRFFVGMQGGVDLETGSVHSLLRTKSDVNGRDTTPEEQNQAAELSKKVNDLTQQVKDLQAKVFEEIDNPGKSPDIKERAQKLADRIRANKLHKPGSFSAATPGSLAWDLGVEAVAKTVEAGGALAKAIQDGLNAVKGTEWYNGLDDEKKQAAETDFENAHKNAAEKSPEEKDQERQDLATQFEGKKDTKFTPREAKQIWDYAKENYIKGNPEGTFDDMVHGVSSDLGLTPDQVRRAISQPKSVRKVTDQMYAAQNKRNQAIEHAKEWANAQDRSGASKFMSGIPRLFFGIKVFGHGTVGMFTHAGINIFRPSSWGRYFSAFGKQFQFSWGGISEAGRARYERAMVDLQRDPQFNFWNRNGLAVDPNEQYNEYANASKIFGEGVNGLGKRGFQALKVFRLAEAKAIWKELPEGMKVDPDAAAQEIAKLVNHSTGTTELKPWLGGTVAFAPRLELSRWQRLVTDPAKAIKTLSNWKNATGAERAAARIVSRRAGEVLGTYIALLAANQGLLKASGSKDDINILHPGKPDWMRFKVGGKDIDPTGGMQTTLRYVMDMGEELRRSGALGSWLKPKVDTEHDRPGDVMIKRTGQQLRYKASPVVSTFLDWATGTDAVGRPTPFSSVKPRIGETKYTVGEYVEQQVGPIPIAEAFKVMADGAKSKGVSKADIKDIMSGIIAGAVSGGTGLRISDENRNK